MPRFHIPRAVKSLVSMDVIADDFEQALVEADKIPVFWPGWKVEDEQLNEPCSIARDDLWDEVTG